MTEEPDKQQERTPHCFICEFNGICLPLHAIDKLARSVARMLGGSPEQVVELQEGLCYSIAAMCPYYKRTKKDDDDESE